MPPIAASYHFGASFAATNARSLYCEQREIEGRSGWQNWPLLCALQLCCWIEDLKTNSLGSRPAIMKMQEFSAKAQKGPKLPFQFFGFLKGLGGKFQVRRLIFALNVLYYTPTHLWEVPHLDSNLTHYLYTLPVCKGIHVCFFLKVFQKMSRRDFFHFFCRFYLRISCQCLIYHDP